MSYQLSSVQAIYQANIHPMSKIKAHLASLNKEQAKSISGEIEGAFFWYKKNPQWYQGDAKGYKTSRYWACLRRVQRHLLELMRKGVFPPELSANGLVLERGTWIDGIDSFDRALSQNPDWKCYYEGPYQSLWANQRTLQIRCYIEGDILTLTASTLEQWQDELSEQEAWYLEHD